MPRLEGLAELNFYPASSDRAVKGKTKLQMRRKPCHLHRIAVCLQVFDYILKILLDEMVQQKPVMEFGAPANQWALVRLFPEPGDQRAQEELLGEAHPRVRWHFES